MIVVVLLLVAVTTVVTMEVAKGHSKVVQSDLWPICLLLPRRLGVPV